MRRFCIVRRHPGAFALAALALLTSLAPRAAAQGPQLNTDKYVGIDQKLDSQVPLGTQFTDETGKKVALKQYFGSRTTILVMPFYRCAGMCTLELDGLTKAMNQMKFSAGKEFNVLTISIDPREQYLLAAQKKKDYMDLYPRPGASEGWHFLTGDMASIQAVAQSVGFRYVLDPKSGTPIHAVGLIILTPQARVSKYLLGVDYSPRDLRLALVDASDNKIGSLADKFTLLCTHYDPTTSRYGVAINRVLEIACAGTVIILAAFIILLFRWERKRARDIDGGGAPGLPHKV